MFESLASYLSIVVAIILGVYIGMRQTLKSLSHMEPSRFIRVIKELRSPTTGIEDALPKNLVRLVITAVDGFLLAHDVETGEFIAQGADSTDLLRVSLSRFPNNTFTMAFPDTIESNE